jgi:hypothetical protein
VSLSPRTARALETRLTGALLGLVLVGALVSSACAGSYSSAGPQKASARSADRLYVAPNGSSGGSCTQSAPCASFDRAYHQAQPGQIVEMACGSYAAQSLRPDPSKDSATANVVFQPAAGCTGATLPNSGFPIQASHLELHGLTMDQTGCVASAPAPNPPCPNISVSTPGHDVVLDGIKSSRFYITGGYNVVIRNSDFGPSYDNHGIVHADSAGNRPHDILIENVAVHDHWNTDVCKATRGCVGQNHQGCGPTLNDSYNVVERRVRWFNCEDLDQLVKPYKFANENIRIENSWFGPGNGFRSLSLTSSKTRPNSGIQLVNNTFTKGLSVTNGVTYPQSALIGNLGPLGSCAAFKAAGFTVDYNVTPGTQACGPHDVAVGSGDLGLAPDWYHLLQTSPALGRGEPGQAPAVDIDGQKRPTTWPSDAGADQREPAELVLGKTIGIAAIGSAEADARAFYGQPRSTVAVRVKNKPGLTRLTYPLHGGALWVTTSGGTVVGVGSSSRYYSTTDGVGPGASTSKIRSLPGTRWVKCRKAYRRYYGGVAVYFTPRGGIKGSVLDSVSMIRRAYDAC